MTEDNFTDYVTIQVASGNGGKGSTHLRREKYIPKGGPDGGDGGRGGHIILKGSKDFWTLFHFKFKQHFKAEHGQNGGKSRSSGVSGKDTIIEVPLGTVVKDDGLSVITEIAEDNQQVVIVKGGRGGRGNWHFRSSVNQTPKYAQQGEEGEIKKFILELKVLADVGLVGFPNAGKSTLLSVMTAAKPKIADYEFTTLKPNLGIVKCYDFRSFIMADIPGIIEGASEGKGLGHYFLRHIERNSILLFLIPCDVKDIVTQYHILLKELKNYNPELLYKQKVIAITKCDLIDEELRQEIQQEIKEKGLTQVPLSFISSFTEEGVSLLKEDLWKHLNEPSE